MKMGYFKLQSGCLLVFSYILWIYWKDTRGANLAYNRYYDGLLAVSPWAIFFDGATAWTVNQPQIVPDAINLLLHGLFLYSWILRLSFPCCICGIS